MLSGKKSSFEAGLGLDVLTRYDERILKSEMDTSKHRLLEMSGESNQIMGSHLNTRNNGEWETERVWG